VLLKLWSAAVCQVVRGSPQEVSEEKELQKLYHTQICAKTAFVD
jgi:hypothetical protein